MFHSALGDTRKLALSACYYGYRGAHCDYYYYYDYDVENSIQLLSM